MNWPVETGPTAAAHSSMLVCVEFSGAEGMQRATRCGSATLDTISRQPIR